MSRAFSSTACWLASALSSSQASQKSMFSSLYSVRRNSRKAPRPAGLRISLSKDCAQLCTSSGLGVLLGAPAARSGTSRLSAQTLTRGAGAGCGPTHHASQLGRGCSLLSWEARHARRRSSFLMAHSRVAPPSSSHTHSMRVDTRRGALGTV